MSSTKSRQAVRIAQLYEETAIKIDKALPPGSVVPRHTADGHFYGVPSGGVYPSVTGIISYVKDPSIQLWQMNEALRYVEAHLEDCVVSGELDMLKTIDLLHNAKKAPTVGLNDASNVGRDIHDRREVYFQKWIDTKSRPPLADFLKPDDDPRLTSAMRALSRFCDETGYVPIRTEVMVYSDKYKLAGMLDDIGLINTVKDKGSMGCPHDLQYNELKTWCTLCTMKKEWEVCLSDLKSSNQFKDSYFYQVALYYMMFNELTGIKMKRNFILKISKDNGNYKIEELKNMHRLVAGAKKIILAAEAVERVRNIRKKSNAPKVLEI
jgi:hypothetical protein